MKISRSSKLSTSSKFRNRLLAAISACAASYGCLLLSSSADSLSGVDSLSGSFESPALAAEALGKSDSVEQAQLKGLTNSKSDRQHIFSSLQLDKAVFLSAMRLPVTLPDQPSQPDSLSSSMNLSLASSSILPLLSAPSDLYDLLKGNQLVQIITDVELSETKSHDTKELTKNLIVTLQKDSPELVQLAKNSQKRKPGHHHSLEATPMEWQGEGSYWYATALDAKHLLVSNKQENIDRVKSRFASSAAFNDLPNRMKLLFADVTGDPDLWQVLDTSIVNESNANCASNQLCEFAKDKTSIVSFVEPGSDALRTVVYSINKTAPDRLSRELSDFKEPADFVLKKIADSKFAITISGAEPKSTKAKVFLLLLTGPMSAG